MKKEQFPAVEIKYPEPHKVPCPFYSITAEQIAILPKIAKFYNNTAVFLYVKKTGFLEQGILEKRIVNIRSIIKTEILEDNPLFTIYARKSDGNANADEDEILGFIKDVSIKSRLNPNMIGVMVLGLLYAVGTRFLGITKILIRDMIHQPRLETNTVIHREYLYSIMEEQGDTTLILVGLKNYLGTIGEMGMLKITPVKATVYSSRNERTKKITIYNTKPTKNLIKKIAWHVIKNEVETDV